MREMVYATIAQLVEQLICNQLVTGSTPVGGSEIFDKRVKALPNPHRGFGRIEFTKPSDRLDNDGSVAEWLKAADCKSADESLRRFESSPAHIIIFIFMRV